MPFKNNIFGGDPLIVVDFDDVKRKKGWDQVVFVWGFWWVGGGVY